MRSIWKGHIRFLLVAIPVRVYNALESSEKIQFNQLHREDYGPIGYDKRCKKCSQIVTNDVLRRSLLCRTRWTSIRETICSVAGSHEADRQSWSRQSCASRS